MPERMGRDFAELVASEFESALARDPQLDLRAYAERRVKELHRPAAIIFADGTSIAPEGTDVPSRHALPRTPRGGGGDGLDAAARTAAVPMAVAPRRRPGARWPPARFPRMPFGRRGAVR